MSFHSPSEIEIENNNLKDEEEVKEEKERIQYKNQNNASFSSTESIYGDNETENDGLLEENEENNENLENLKNHHVNDVYDPKRFHQSLLSSHELKELGNNSFKENNLQEAKRYYEEAIELLKPYKNIQLSEEIENETENNNLNNNENENCTNSNLKITKEKIEEYKGLSISLYGNKSMVLFKEENWIQVISSTEEVLNEEPNNVKALYRRAVAYHRIGNYEESKQGLNRVLALDSNNNAAKKELNELTKTIKEQKQKEKNVMSSMFSKGSIYNDREEERQRKLRRVKEEEEKLHDEYLKEKLKKRSEGFPSSEIDISFEAWKTARKKKEEENKKNEEKRQEDERKKKKSENKTTRKKQRTATASTSDGLEYDEEER